MASLLRWLLLLVAAGSAAAQLFDCSTATQRVPEGQSVLEGCERLTCTRGELAREACASVPVGCTVVSQNANLDYPGCCPRWQCAGGGSGGGAGGRLPASGDRGGGFNAGSLAGSPTSCPHGGGSLASGQTKQASGCRRLKCNSGVLTTEFCRSVPPLCTVVKEDVSRPFPDCCPVWSCTSGGNVGSGGRRGGAGVPQGGSGTCTHNGRRIANGQSIQGPNCQRFDCRDGTVTTHFCSDVPAGCVTVIQDVGKPFPECCPKWRCN